MFGGFIGRRTIPWACATLKAFAVLVEPAYCRRAEVAAVYSLSQKPRAQRLAPSV
jgi:hypothetical protein